MAAMSLFPESPGIDWNSIMYEKAAKLFYI